ncbi:MAG: hypothetical protein RLN74_03545, partial [Ilumatobacter fluminis]
METSGASRRGRFMALMMVLGTIAATVVVQFSGPEPVARAESAVSISAGDEHTCAVLNDATIECWGDNGRGALGDPIAPGGATPVAVPGLTDIVEVSAGFGITCARDDSGDIWCWGANNQGAATGTPGSDATSPVQIPLSDVFDVSAGYTHSCAVVATGEAYCWGNDSSGQLGDGPGGGSGIVQVSGVTDAVEISAAQFFTCLRHAGGTVSCWGNNSFGKAGINPAGGFVHAPNPIAGLTDVVQVATEQSHVCALTGSGTVWCWGAGDFGQLGTGASGGGSASSAPLQVPGLPEIAQIEVMSVSTCALDVDGDLWCWGSNYRGAIMQSAGVPFLVSPVEIEPPFDVVDISSGAGHSCVASGTGSAWCWG